MNDSMNTNRRDRSSARRVPRRERGQILALALVSLSAFFCFCGFVIDTARMYIAYQQLQVSTDAAALAGGVGLAVDKPTAIADATSYSGISGNQNSNNLSGVTFVQTPQVECIAYTTLPIACSAAAGIYNAIQVQQKVTVPMTFAQFFGTNSVTLTATATASSKGTSTPFNIALVIDTTSSMGTGGSDSCTDPYNSKKYTTSIGCALIGAKVLMLDTAPCYADAATCDGTPANSVDMISLFAFPPVEANTAANDYSNGCGGPTVNTTSGYAFQATGTSTYAPNNSTTKNPTNTAPTYQITPFLADYRTSDTATTLNPSSNLVKAIGQVSGCAGLQTPGGLGTYYAGALMAAQAALLQEQAVSGREKSANAIVILSDGQANATTMASTDSSGNTVSTTASTYPSTINQCQQADNIAGIITTAGTRIYSVAYGAPSTASSKSTGCTTDTSGSSKFLSACTAMQNVASTGADFFTDTPAGKTASCTSALAPAAGLAQIFGAIASDLGSARLIPNTVF
jgi:hypothetical protein